LGVFAGFVTIFGGAIVCSFLWAISYPPPPSSWPITQANKSGTATERQPSEGAEHGTEHIPFVVTIVPPKEGTPEAQRDEQERLQKTANERGLILATWLLAFATTLIFAVAVTQAVLFLWQLRLIRDGLRPAEVAANAAKESADAAIATERAYVFPGYDPITYSQEGHATIPLVMTNAGKTPAVIKQVGYAFLNRTDLPASRDHRDWEWETITYDWAITTNERKPIKSLVSPYAGDNVFVCYIRYVEIFVYKGSVTPKPIHTCWMSMLIRPTQAGNERITRVGSDVWNEWD
jgi:hypothetical protein